MRCDQFPGLPVDALAFLEQWGLRCCHCQQPLPSSIVIGHYSGMFENQHSLIRYELTDGRHADEFLQAEHLSSGPMFFLGLRVSDGTRYVWTQEEIDNATG